MSELDIDDAAGQNAHQTAGSGHAVGPDSWLGLRDDHRIILYALVSLALVIGGHRTWREYHRYRENATRRAKIHRLVESSRREKEKERERKVGSAAVEAVVDNNSHSSLPAVVAAAKSNTHDDHPHAESAPDLLSSKSLASSTPSQDLRARPENATGNAKRAKERKKRGRDVYKEALKQDRKKPQTSISPAPSSPSSPHHPNSINAQASASHSLLQVQASTSDAEASHPRSRSRSSSRERSHSYSRVRGSDSSSRSRSGLREELGEVEVLEEAETEGSSEDTPKPDSAAQTLFTESTFHFDQPPPPETATATQQEYRDDVDGQSDRSSSFVPPDSSFTSSITNSQNGNVHMDESNVSTAAGRQEELVSCINDVATTTNITMIRGDNFKTSGTPTPPLTHSGPSSATSSSGTASEPASGSSSTSVSVSGFEAATLASGGIGVDSPVLRSYNFDFELELRCDPRVGDAETDGISISQPVPSVPSGKSHPVWLGLRDGDESRSRDSPRTCSREHSERHEGKIDYDANDVTIKSRKEHAPKTPSSSSFSSVAVSDTSASASVTSVSVSATSSSSSWAETKERLSGTSLIGNGSLNPGQRFNERRRVNKGNNARGKSKSPPPPRFRSLSRPSGSTSGSASGSGSGSRSRGSPYHSNSLPLPLPLPLPMAMTSLSAGVSPSSTPPPYTPGSLVGASGAYGYRAASESAIRRREAEHQRRELERYKSEVESVRARWVEDVERGRRREVELQAQLQMVTSQMHALSLTISQMQMHPHSFFNHPPPTPNATQFSQSSRSQNLDETPTSNSDVNSNSHQQQQNQHLAYPMPPMYNYPNTTPQGHGATGSPLPMPPHIPLPYIPGTAMYPPMYSYPLMSTLPPNFTQRSNLTSGSRSGSQSNSGDGESEGAGSVNGSRGRNRNGKANGRTSESGSGNASPSREYEYEYEYDHAYDYDRYYAIAPTAGPFDFSRFGFGMWPGQTGQVESVTADFNTNVGEETATTEPEGADEEGGPSTTSAGGGGGSLGVDVGEGVSEELVEAILKRPGSINFNASMGRSPSVPTPRRAWSGSVRSASVNSGAPANASSNAISKPGVGAGVEGRASSEGFTFASLSELGNPQPRRQTGIDDAEKSDGISEKRPGRKGDWLVFDTSQNAGVNTDATVVTEASHAVEGAGDEEARGEEIPLVASPEAEEAHAFNLSALGPDSVKHQGAGLAGHSNGPGESELVTPDTATGGGEDAGFVKIDEGSGGQ